MMDLKANNISFSYTKKRQILKDVSLSLKSNEIIGLIGDSGSGKSTLMQELIYDYALHKLRGNRPKPQGIDDILGFEHIDKVIDNLL